MTANPEELETSINNLIRFAEEMGKAATEIEYRLAFDQLFALRSRLFRQLGLTGRSLSEALNANHD